MQHPNLREQAATSVMLVSLSRIVTRVLDLVTLMVLTRILLPEQFGLVAIAMSIIQICEVVFSVPIEIVLVPIKKLEREHFGTVFTIALIRGALIALALVMLAYPLALFFGDLRLFALICALALAPIVRGLRNPRMIELIRAHRFAQDAAIEVIGKLVALGLASWLAIATGSYWAIAIGTIVSPFLTTILTYVILPFRPTITLRSWKLFARYFGWNTSSQLISAANWQSDRIILGKIVSQAELGLFAMSRNLAGTVIQAMAEAMGRPFLATLSAVNQDRERVARAYVLIVSSVVSLGLPLLVGQALVARELVVIMFGHKWIDAAPMLQGMSIALIPTLFSNAANSLFYAMHHPEKVFSRNLYDFLFRVPAVIVLSLAYGWLGAVIALAASELVLVGICATSIRSLLGTPILAQFRASSRSVLSVIIMGIVIAVLRMNGLADYTGGSSLAFLAVVVPVAAITYIGVHVTLWAWLGRPHGLEAIAGQIFAEKFRAKSPTP